MDDIHYAAFYPRCWWIGEVDHEISAVELGVSFSVVPRVLKGLR